MLALPTRFLELGDLGNSVSVKRIIVPSNFYNVAQK